MKLELIHIVTGFVKHIARGETIFSSNEEIQSSFPVTSLAVFLFNLFTFFTTRIII